MLRGVILAVTTAVLLHVDMSRLYHIIRGQAMIKLYVLFTMIEILDKLGCSLGQDVLDALYFTTKFQHQRIGRLAFDLLVATFFVDILFAS